MASSGERGQQGLVLMTGGQRAPDVRPEWPGPGSPAPWGGAVRRKFISGCEAERGVGKGGSWLGIETWGQEGEGHEEPHR